MADPSEPHPIPISTFVTDLDALVAEAMSEWKIPGLAIAVIRRGEPAFLKAYGERDVEAKLPLTTETHFSICSITKTFTAVGLALLVDEGRLDWTKPVGDYIPEFRLHDSIATDRVTVRDLLCHHTGLPRHDWIWAPADLSDSEMLAAMRHLEPSEDMRNVFQYQNLGYLTAGIVTERISGQRWPDFMQARLIDKLAMTVSFTPEDLASAADAAVPYAIDGDTRLRTRLWPIRTTAPAASIHRSVRSPIGCAFFSITASSRARSCYRPHCCARCRRRACTCGGPNSRRSATCTMGSDSAVTTTAATGHWTMAVVGLAGAHS
jgi:CubicO group peptidase (beta-lactamase class C family)